MIVRSLVIGVLIGLVGVFGVDLVLWAARWAGGEVARQMVLMVLAYLAGGLILLVAWRGLRRFAVGDQGQDGSVVVDLGARRERLRRALRR